MKLLKGAESLLGATGEEVFTPEDFSDEQKQIGETTEQFVVKEVLPHLDEIEQQKFELNVELMRKCGELGLLMLDAPKEYGGLELDKVTNMLMTEKISQAGSFSITFSAHTGIGTLPLVYYGTKELKEKYLPKIMSGEWVAAYCLTEPGSGSDALGAKSTAELTPDKKFYVLNGTKQFISNGGFAHIYTIFAKTGKELSAFLVERDTPGLSFGHEEKKMGIKGSSTTQVIMQNVKVPVGNLLGEEGKGHKIAFNVLNIGRLKLGAGVTGAAKVALADGIKYANQRKQFGKLISSFGAIKEKIADMTAAIFASEALVYRLAGMIDARVETVDRGSPDYYKLYQKGIEEYAIECAISKVFCSEMLAGVVSDVLQMYGGYGYIQEYPAERYYRDERINRIFEGTNEINRMLVSGTVMGRGHKGDIPLKESVSAAVDALKGEPAAPGSGPFGAEKALLAGMKNVFLVLTGAAMRKFLFSIKDEQEVLMALADIAINIFALESAVLRAEKILPKLSGDKKTCAQAAVKVFAFASAEKAASAARRSAAYVKDGKDLDQLLAAIGKHCLYRAEGLLKAKRQLADAAIEAEKFIFA